MTHRRNLNAKKLSHIPRSLLLKAVVYPSKPSSFKVSRSSLVLLRVHKFNRLPAPTSLVVGPISRDGHPERREEDVALELSLGMENEEPHHSGGREGDLEGIGAIFVRSMNIADPENFHEEVADYLAGIA
jgi:hypothetical protein